MSSSNSPLGGATSYFLKSYSFDLNESLDNIKSKLEEKMKIAWDKGSSESQDYEYIVTKTNNGTCIRVFDEKTHFLFDAMLQNPKIDRSNWETSISNFKIILQSTGVVKLTSAMGNY